jgi:hypothetical protein
MHGNAGGWRRRSWRLPRPNWKNEKAKTQTLGRELDDALRVAHGGSPIQRVARAAKWFVIGAAAGALAAKVAC